MHAFDKFVKCDHITNNMTESGNTWFGKMKKAPVIVLVEYIRKWMVKAIPKRRKTCLKWLNDVLTFINKR